MATYEHATAIGSWFFKALMESSKLRLMTFNEEAAHRNKPNCRVQHESRWTGVAAETYASYDAAHALILQGSHYIVDEAAAPQDVIHAYVPYPQGPGLGPFLRRPIPVVNGMRGVQPIFPGSPTLDLQGWNELGSLAGNLIDFHASNSFFSLPETAVGIIGIDAVTDFTTSLVISHRWSNNDSGAGIGAVHHGGYLFWRVIGHVAAY